MECGAFLVEEVGVCAGFECPILAVFTVVFSLNGCTTEAKAIQKLSVSNTFYMVNFFMLVVLEDEFLVDGVLIVKNFCMAVVNGDAFSWICA
jgi:hypothetical protein